jgi:site-specific recombinase XerC
VSTTQGAIWILPCCYEPPFAQDLDEAARLLKLDRDDLVALRVAAILRVYMYGCMASRRVSSISAACRKRSPFRGVRSRGRRIRPAPC